MTLYRQTIRVLSSFVTAFKGDTIWGHVVWGIAHNEGDEGVFDFLHGSKKFITSSAFPHDYLPRPLEFVDLKTPEDKKSYAEIKKKRKNPYVKAAAYFDNVSVPEVDNSKLIKTSVVRTHNTISRFDNSVIDGSLFSVEENWLSTKDDSNLLDVYVVTDYQMSDVHKFLSWAFENGFGSDSSIGKGRVELIGDVIEMKRKKDNKNGRYMALGPFVSDRELEDLRAQIFIRNGKIGGDFSPYLSPYKKTVLLFDEGATFKSEVSLQYVGEMLENMHETSEYNICQSGFAPVIEV